MNAQRALVAAIAGNADPAKPEVVLSQAVEALRLEAESLSDAFAERDNDLSCRLIYFAGRVEALEAFVDCLAVDYQDEHADAFCGKVAAE